MTVAMRPSTAAGNVLFAKNSDRHCNEAQVVEYHGARSYDPNSLVRCTYLTIPQSSRTHAVFLCRPFWIWGAEMGTNQHGLVIGNEGLHARSAGPEVEALTGMDLVRLALERAATAHEALDVITQLLNKYGQGGNCGYKQPIFYNNGFIIADYSAAFVLETVNREWVVEKVADVRSMSNVYSIGKHCFSRSAGLVSLINDLGWSNESQPDHAAAITNPHREHIGNAGARSERSAHLLKANAGRLKVADVMQLLRDHGTARMDTGKWTEKSTVKRTLCMHAGSESSSQTVGSMVSDLRQNASVHWITAVAAPCISVFRPVLMDASLPKLGPAPTGKFDPSSLWWRHEQLHRVALLSDFGNLVERVTGERDALEGTFRARIDNVLLGGSVGEKSAAVAACWSEAEEMEVSWLRRQFGHNQTRRRDAYGASWSVFNLEAGFVEGLQVGAP